MSEEKKTLKFLFVYPDFLGNEKRKDMKGNYHEGIAIISAVLKQHGYQTALYHLTYAPGRSRVQGAYPEKKCRYYWLLGSHLGGSAGA